MTKEVKEKGFKVTDRRVFSPDKEERKEKEIKKEEEKEGFFSDKGEEKRGIKEEDKEEKRQEIPKEITFSSFIFSLSTSALLHFGEIPDPISKKRERNLSLAKQSIDILGMLKEKTKGNLSKEEESLIDNLLYDLRMRYVQETQKD